MVADLTDPIDRQRVIPEAVEALGGPVEILVNNAAASIQAPLVEVSVKRRNIMFEVNANAPLDLSLAVVPDMVEAGEGWIVNLSSASANLWPGPGTELERVVRSGSSPTAPRRPRSTASPTAWPSTLYGTGVRVNTVEPRAAVLSEGAAELVGNILKPEQIEPMEAMVEGTVFLCDCPADLTGRITVSLDNIEQHGLTVHDLDGHVRP